MVMWKALLPLVGLFAAACGTAHPGTTAPRTDGSRGSSGYALTTQVALQTGRAESDSSPLARRSFRRIRCECACLSP